MARPVVGSGHGGVRDVRRDARYGEWTFRAIVDRARQLLVGDDDPFDDLIDEVYGGTRIPKLVVSLVGSAINEARSTVQGSLDLN